MCSSGSGKARWLSSRSTRACRWELHTSVRPALEALVSGARLTFGDLAERSGLTMEQVAALATELVSKDAAAVSHR
ncbi:hypothetical protein [Streptomyces spororaveus]|uniref:Uncharacterized protein n=1 Tax=Streptomyces spororaveus TaxID=284039 RepID=A0ABQ3TQ36_9ACTN|nr:hypothetical protein [Streptomyces spororaveus]MCM9077150.1 hypothetical protein [Streptomyces spororaveus]GHI74988.1 hypothetical protein Sspor_05490 [Streptomyces spororaveus]GHI82542.1 hypothetical protein Sspor_81030 [Streptomyces spororaveus]